MTAHKTKIIDPSKAGVSKNFQSGLVIMTTKATAPEGGCSVLVICIMPIALETAIPIAQGEEPRKFRIIKLVRAAKKLPPMTFRG
jgi:hypothetical protein